MIRTEAEYRRTKQQMEELRRQLVEHKQALEAEGDSPEEIQRELDPLSSFCDQMQDEVALYERITAGQVPPLDDLDDLGLFLIAARLAQRVSQRELARRLHVSESVVSRDEANEYHGIAKERVARILRALEMDVQMTPVLRSENRSRPTADARTANPTSSCETVQYRLDLGSGTLAGSSLE